MDYSIEKNTASQPGAAVAMGISRADSRQKTFHILTLGCKVNQYESEAIREIFLADGYRESAALETADVYIVNTCTVTNVAAKKSRQMLARGKKKNPNCVVIAVGCYVQREHQLLRELGIDILIGNDRKKEILTLLSDYYRGREIVDAVVEGYHKPEYEELVIANQHERARATIKIQDGCNQFCTYCIIPFARGRVRSRRPGRILEEIRGLVAAGYQEFVITGIHLTSYGLDFTEEIGLIDLLEEIDQIEGVRRIRLGSLEPRLITPEFAERIAKRKHLCPHFHLSLQSGSDAVLAGMNRRYRTADFAAGIRLLRQVYAAPAITTDVIVGFPGESDTDFADSLQFVKEIGFADLHVFKYSKRVGTKAADMPNQVAEEVKNARSSQMIALGEASKRAYLQGFIGKTAEVLPEEEVQVAGQRYTVGHTREYIKVYLPVAEKEPTEAAVRLGELFADGMKAEWEER